MMRLNQCARREDFFPPLTGRQPIAEGDVVFSAAGTRQRKAASRPTISRESAAAGGTGAIQEVDLWAAGRSLECGRAGTDADGFCRDARAKTDPFNRSSASRTRARTAASEAPQRAACTGQLRKSSSHHASLRVECRRTTRSVLWRGAQRDRRRGSWQIAYLPGRFERIQHVLKKYACAKCEGAGEAPQIEVAARAEVAIEKGLAGPGLLSYIVTSKFADYLPLYRLEDIFTRQGFEISRATHSVWCGDVADLVEPLVALMAERVRTSHVVATDDTILPMLSKGKAA